MRPRERGVNPRRRSGHDYQSSYLCKRPNCSHIAHYGCRGLCQKHHDAYQRDLVSRGELAGRTRVDAAPVAEHIKKLQGRGRQMASIAHLSGVSTMTLYRIHSQETVQSDTAARIMRIPIP